MLRKLRKTMGDVGQCWENLGKLLEMLDNVEKTIRDDNGKENDKGC